MKLTHAFLALTAVGIAVSVAQEQEASDPSFDFKALVTDAEDTTILSPDLNSVYEPDFVEASGPIVGRNFFEIPLDENTTVTVYPDYSSAHHYYYLPVRPRVPTVKIGEEEVPNVSLVKWNLRDGDQIIQGGILNFAITLGLTPQQMEVVENFIMERMSIERVFVAMMPITSAQATVLYGADEQTAQYILGNGACPRRPGSDAVFSVRLTPAGVSIFDALLSGTGGLGVNVTYEYEAYTPDLDVTVTGDLVATRDYFAKSEELQAKVGGWFWSASYSKSSEEIRDILDDQRLVTIDWKQEPPNTPEGKKLKEMIYTNIFDRVFKEIMDASIPDTPIDAPRADAPNNRGFYQAGYSVAVKDVEQIKKKSIRVNLKGRQRLAVSDEPIGMFVNVANLTDAQRELVFREAEPDEYFNTLSVNTIASLNPEPYGLTSLTFSYTSTIPGTATIERTFVPSADGTKLERASADSWDIEFPTSRDYEVSYKTKFVVSPPIGRETIEVVGSEVPLPQNGYTTVYFANNTAGIKYIEFDFASIYFTTEDLVTHRAPHALIAIAENEKNRYAFRVVKESKFMPVILPFSSEGGQVKLTVIARNWMERGRIVGNKTYRIDDLDAQGGFVFLNNADFFDLPIDE